ncbi:MAG: hypothetical protein GC165_18490 [Armatimonadetes bacterium]|nr:hypothetical protein [Armatimonadota bacterium]
MCGLPCSGETTRAKDLEIELSAIGLAPKPENDFFENRWNCFQKVRLLESCKKRRRLPPSPRSRFS